MSFAPALALLALSAPPAPVAFDWQFKDTVFLDVRHTAKQAVTVLDKTKRTETTVRLLFEVRPVSVRKGETTLDLTVKACDMTGTTDGEPDEDDDTFDGLVGQTVRATLSAGNQKLTLAVTPELTVAVFGDEAKTGTPAERAFARDMLEVILRVHLLDAFMPVPTTPAATWRHTADLVMPPCARVTTAREFTRIGRVWHDGRAAEAVNWASTVTLKPLDADDTPLPFRITAITPVTDPRNVGTVLWDTAAGRPLRVDAVQEYEFAMTLDLEGKPVEGTGKGTDTFVVRFHATNPDDD